MNVYSRSMHHHQMLDKFQLSCSAWVNNLWHINIMGDYSAIKRNGLLTHRTPWLDLKVTILGEIRQQFQKTVYCMILFIWKSQKAKSVVTENRSGLPGSRGGGRVDHKETACGNFWVCKSCFVSWLLSCFKWNV